MKLILQGITFRYRLISTIVCCISLLMTACTVNHVEQLQPRIEFIQPGVTTRQAIIDAFGRPSLAFEDDRLLVYVFETAESEPIIGPRRPADDNGPHLVVEFDEQGTVTRSLSLVPP